MESGFWSEKCVGERVLCKLSTVIHSYPQPCAKSTPISVLHSSSVRQYRFTRSISWTLNRAPATLHNVCKCLPLFPQKGKIFTHFERGEYCKLLILGWRSIGSVCAVSIVNMVFTNPIWHQIDARLPWPTNAARETRQVEHLFDVTHRRNQNESTY